MQPTVSPLADLAPALPELSAEDIAILCAACPAATGANAEALRRLLADPAECFAILDQPWALQPALNGQLSPLTSAFLRIRHALRAEGLDDRCVAAYLARTYLHFKDKGLLNSMHFDQAGLIETVDVLRELNFVHGSEELELLARSGNYFLFLLTFFAELFEERHRSCGAPAPAYYEAFTRCAFRAARDHHLSSQYHINAVCDVLCDHVGVVRKALAGLSAFAA